MDITSIYGGVKCPACGWLGQIVDLRVNKLFNVGCPKCEGGILPSDYGLSIHEFMDLPLIAKPFFICDDMEGSQYAEGSSADVLKKVILKQRKDINRLPDEDGKKNGGGG